MKKIYYFDHAASSWPKPPEVIEAMKQAVEEYGANPGRGSHYLAMKASRTLFQTRKRLAELFRINNENDISFCINTSYALNQAIQGYLREGDHVITTALEHNSVRRPLEYLKRKIGISVTYLPADERGQIDLNELKAALTNKTRMLIVNHSSNLLGTILPIDKMSEIVKKKDVCVLADAAQTAGTYPIDVRQLGIDMLAFPGHKGLLGPQGTGGLYVRSGIELEPLIHGGTGSRSEEVLQPDVLPDRFETGTQNTPGIAGLGAGVAKVLEETPEKIHRREWELTQMLMEGLLQIRGIQLLGPPLGEPRTGIVSFTLAGWDASEVAYVLDREYQIAVRAGHHCSPLAHQTAGTEKTGAVRASVGFYTSEDEVRYFIDAVKAIANRRP